MTVLKAGLLALLLALCAPNSRAADDLEAWRRCLEPLKVGPGKAAIPRWYYDASQAKCVEFQWGGAEPNGNNFALKAACKATCKDVPLCELPPAAGSGDVACMAYIPRYFWNSTSGKCEQFIYGGCGGNANNFESVNDCQLMCKPKPDFCSLQQEVGPCRGRIQRFYYDATKDECFPFFWGGCKGNQNKFVTRLGCRKACKWTAPKAVPLD
ncbi:hypothetical protein ABPG75_009300 [Micractinium tetrahymenae]